MYLKITLHSAAAEEIIKNYITFLDPGGINYVIIVGPTVIASATCASLRMFLHVFPDLPRDLYVLYDSAFYRAINMLTRHQLGWTSRTLSGGLSSLHVGIADAHAVLLSYALAEQEK